MKTVLLQETPTHYLIKIEREAVEEGTTFVEKAGKTVAVLLSSEEYKAFRAWQSTQQKAAISAEFEAEVAAFEQLKPSLLEQFPGRVVAIHQGQVVEVSDDKMEVLSRVQEKLGNVTCYVEWVEPEAPRRVRLPSVRTANQ